MFDAVFIDADNTLFDFDRTEAKALSQSLLEFDLPSGQDVLELYESINSACWQAYHEGKLQNGEINRLRWQQWLSAIKRDDVAAELLAAHYADALAQQCEKEDGADELIDFLSSRVPVHVITNGFPSSQAHRWRKAGWLDKLQGITVSAEVGVQKPEAEIFHIAMKAVGQPDAERCLMIGDSLVPDVEGPQGVGMKGCWYQRGESINTTEIKPDFVVTHLDQIPSLF